MMIDFFKDGKGLKIDAIKGGVYLVELLKEGNEQAIPLYVGESGSMVKRCGEHLYTLFGEPNYFGLTQNDISQGDLTIRISDVDIISEKKKFIWDKNYKDKELAAIDKHQPITQSRTSDKQIKNKVEVVQNKMKELGFK